MGASIGITIKQNSQDVSYNTSNVTVTVTLDWTDGTWNNNKMYGELYIDGVTYGFNANFNWNGASTSGSVVLLKKTVDVDHNSDGTKTLSCSAYFEYHKGEFAQGSASKKLTTIPRNSSVTLGATSIQMGKQLLIAISRQSTSFKHTLKYTFGGTTATIATSVGTSYTWTVPDLAAKCNNATSGKATITCIAYNGSTKVGQSTATVTLTVPDATTPSFPDGNVILGSGNSIKADRGSTNFKLDITYEFNGATGTVVTDGTTDIVWWAPYDLAARIPKATSGTGKLTCVTKNGTATVGTKTVNFTVEVPNNSTTQPKFTEEGFVLSPSGLLPDAFSGMYIRGKTGVKAEFSAESTCSTIASYKLTVSGMSASGNPAISGYLSVSGEVKVTGTVTDARGYSTSVTKTITVIPYDNPRVIPYNGQNIVICERCLTDGLADPGGQNLLIKAGRKYSQVAVDGVQKNFCELKYRYKTSSGDSFGDWITLIKGTEVLNDEISIIAVGIVPSATTSYHVQIAVADTIGSEIPMDIIVPTDDVTFHLRTGGKGAAVGKYSEEDYLFDIHSDWDLGLKGGRIMDFVLEQGTSGIWRYRKWYSGLYECWGTDMTVPSSGNIAGTFPISFPEKPKMFVSNTYDSAGFNVVIKQVSTAGGVWRYLLYIRDTSGAVRNVNADGIDLYVVGRWK